MNDFLKILLSGALGAIIALFIKQYFDHRRTMYARLLRHNDSLVILQSQLMDIDSAIHDNRIAFQQIVDGVKNKRIMTGRPQTFFLEDSFFKDSLWSELSNKLYAFRYNLRRVNYDIENLNRSYNLLSDAVTLRKITADVFLQHAEGLLAEKEEFLNAFDSLQAECVQLIGYVKARSKIDRNWLMRHRNKVLKSHLREVTDEEIQESVAEYEESIRENSEKDGK